MGECDWLKCGTMTHSIYSWKDEKLRDEPCLLWLFTSNASELISREGCIIHSGPLHALCQCSSVNGLRGFNGNYTQLLHEESTQWCTFPTALYLASFEAGQFKSVLLVTASVTALNCQQRKIWILLTYVHTMCYSCTVSAFQRYWMKMNIQSVLLLFSSLLSKSCVHRSWHYLTRLNQQIRVWVRKYFIPVLINCVFLAGLASCTSLRWNSDFAQVLRPNETFLVGSRSPKWTGSTRASLTLHMWPFPLFKYHLMKALPARHCNIQKGIGQGFLQIPSN